MLANSINLVEIDLVRAGEHTVAAPQLGFDGERRPDYLISVCRAAQRGAVFELWPCRLRDPLPTILIPLGECLPDVELDLQTLLRRELTSGRYAD